MFGCFDYIAHAQAPFGLCLSEGVPSGTTTYRSVWVILSGLLPEGAPYSALVRRPLLAALSQRPHQRCDTARETIKSNIHRLAMDICNENDQANRAISTGKLHALPHFHTRPINVVVFHGSDREYSFSGGFPA